MFGLSFEQARAGIDRFIIKSDEENTQQNLGKSDLFDSEEAAGGFGRQSPLGNAKNRNFTR